MASITIQVIDIFVPHDWNFEAFHLAPPKKVPFFSAFFQAGSISSEKPVRNKNNNKQQAQQQPHLVQKS